MVHAAVEMTGFEARGKLAGGPYLGRACLGQHDVHLAGWHRDFQMPAVELANLPGRWQVVGQLATAHAKGQGGIQREGRSAVGGQALGVEAGIFDASDQGVVQYALAGALDEGGGIEGMPLASCQVPSS